MSNEHRIPVIGRGLPCVAALSLLAAPAAAHHSNAIFDLEHSVTLDGIVTVYEWANPHVYFQVQVRDESGAGTVWIVEASPPALMVQRGWSPETLARGDHVVIEANPARAAAKRMALGRTMRKDDGTQLVVSANEPGAGRRAFVVPPASPPATSLSGTWQALPGGPTMEFLFGPKTWALTERGAESVEQYDGSKNPAADCVAYTAPFTMVIPDMKAIAVGDDVVTIRSSLDGAERLVHMDIESHDGAAFSNQGHAIGRWEESVLVVDTASFDARENGNAFSLASSRGKHLVERYRLSEDGTRLIYRFVLEDPEYIAAPVTGQVQWAHVADPEFVTPDCDLENARRYLDAAAD